MNSLRPLLVIVKEAKEQQKLDHYQIQSLLLFANQNLSDRPSINWLLQFQARRLRQADMGRDRSQVPR